MKYNLKALEYTCKGSKMRHQENFCLGVFSGTPTAQAPG